MVIPKDKSQESKMSILATIKCKTMSGRSTLTYHLGKGEADARYIRIFSNTGNGYFSAEWVSLDAILAILEKHGDATFTSRVLEELFRGKSVNTPAFLAAVLLHEKVIAPEVGKSRKYRMRDASSLLAKYNRPAKPRRPVKKAVKKAEPKVRKTK